MKAKSLILTMMAMLFTFSSAIAQSHIDKIVDELEQKGVDISKVVRRDPKTKKIVSETKNLSFYSKDSNYANRLKEAFKKDAEDAVQETVNNHGNTHLLIFKNGTKSAHYNLTITPKSGKDPLVQLYIKMSIINNDGNIKLEGLEGFDFYDFFNLNKINRNKNFVLIRGGVGCPGLYELGKNITTVHSLIEQSGGITSDAIVAHSVIYRMKDDNTLEELRIDIAGIKAGTVADMPLKNNDVLFIPTQTKREATNIKNNQKKQNKQS